MPEFEYQPWKKVIVHEVIKLPIESFTSQHSLGVPPGGIGVPIRWADGVLFDIVGIRETDEVIKEKLEGRIHYTGINYGILEEYQPEFKVAGNIRIPVVNVSNNEVFKDGCLDKKDL